MPTNTFYYGVRYAHGCDPSELFVTYFTSSKYVTNLIKCFGVDSFQYEIRKTFSNADKARKWETKVLKRINAVSRNDFINKTDNISIDPKCASKSMKGKTGEKCPKFGKKNSTLSEINSLKIGSLNPMFGKRGELAPCFGRNGEKHPMFGKTNLGASNSCKQEVTCPHCNKTGKRGGMQKWHFNNCKLKGD